MADYQELLGLFEFIGFIEFKGLLEFVVSSQ